MLKSLSIWIFD